MSTHHRPARAVRVARALLALATIVLIARTAQAQPRPGNGLPEPRLLLLTPSGGKAGSSLEVTFSGTDLEEPQGLLFSHAGIKAEAVADSTKVTKPDPKKKPPKRPRPGMGTPVVTRFKVTIDPGVPVGIHDVRLVNKWGVSNPRAFVVGDLAETQEKEPNSDVDQAQRVALNTTINGAMANPTDVDYYVFAGKKGQRIVLSCLASSIDSRFTPAIELYDAKGKQLAGNRNYNERDALTDCVLPEDGDYYVRLFQFTHTQGSPEHFYRLSITTAPWIDAVFPCVVEPGKTTSVTVYGRNLPGGKPDGDLEKATVPVTAPATPEAVSRLTFGGRLAPGAIGLAGFELRLRNESGSSNPFLITLARAPVVLDNGSNDTAETAQEVTLPCEIAGQVEKRRDRDWYTFAAKKGEVYTIEVLSQRLGAPTYMYFQIRGADKREIYESQDNQDTLSRKFWTHTEDPMPYRFVVPADGKYRLLVGSHVGDTLAGPRHFYRVRITPEQPDFQLAAVGPDDHRPGAPVLLKGGNQSFTVFAWRQDGFVGDIALSIEGLPPGVTCPPQTLGGDLRHTHLVLSADAKAEAWTGIVKIKGTATINGKKVVREARSGCVVWPVPFQQNMVTISRLDRASFLAVRDKAPLNLTATIDKDVVVQGEKATIKLNLKRLWPDLKAAVSVQVMQSQQRQDLQLPQNLRVNNNQAFNLAAGKSDGTLNVTVANDVQPGTYNIVLRAQAQSPFNKDPKSKAKRPTFIVQPSTPVTLTVLPKELAKLTLNNGSPTVKVGKEVEVTVQLRRLFHYDGPFKVEVVLPKSVNGLEVAEVTVPAGKDSAKLVVRVPAGTKPGNRSNLIVRATGTYHGRAIKHEAKLNVNVVK